MSGNVSGSLQGSAQQPMDDREQDILQFLKPLSIDDSTVHILAYRFSKVYQELALSSEEQFLPTPVTGLPTGSETGRFLAIDVGGTNLRVAFIELLGEGSDSIVTTSWPEKDTIRNAQRPRVRRTLEKAWPIGEHLKIDKTEDLFAWIGDCIAEVVGDYLSNDTSGMSSPDELDLGITFSFPMIQDELTSATLMPMGKGFTITENLDLGSTLLQGYARHTRRQDIEADDEELSRSKRRRLGPLPRLRIAAITNDTIATLCSLAYSVKSLPNSRVAAGLIVGTGCNATIPVKFDALGRQKAQRILSKRPSAIETVVNTEMTIAGACEPLKLITTTWDEQLDKSTARPGFQPLEYMTGGRYIGELVRLIFFDYMTNVHRPPVSKSSLPAMIVHNYSLTTTFVSAVVARARTDAELCRDLKHRMPAPESSNWSWTPHSAGALRKVAQAVQVRSAGLIAASTIGLLAAVREIDLSKPANLAEETSETVPDLTNGHEQASQGLGSTSGPEELVIAYTGGIIQHYPNFKEHCQRFIDKLIMKSGPQSGGKSVYLRESRDGGIIGAGVLAGMESTRVAAIQA